LGENHTAAGFGLSFLSEKRGESTTTTERGGGKESVSLSPEKKKAADYLRTLNWGSPMPT